MGLSGGDDLGCSAKLSGQNSISFQPLYYFNRGRHFFAQKIIARGRRKAHAEGARVPTLVGLYPGKSPTEVGTLTAPHLLAGLVELIMRPADGGSIPNI
jgi:hypothetical protein